VTFANNLVNLVSKPKA